MVADEMKGDRSFLCLEPHGALYTTTAGWLSVSPREKACDMVELSVLLRRFDIVVCFSVGCVLEFVSMYRCLRRFGRAE